jgi:exopolyphosphatase/guanosine-5'-triphosphate,3'-diphosphate pyrophosphatase
VTSAAVRPIWQRSTSAPTASTSSSLGLLENGYEVVTREKETVRLGHGGGDMKELSADAIDRGISSLRRMQRIASSHNASLELSPPARSARRRTPTCSSPRARREAKVDVEVISGLEEAR